MKRTFVILLAFCFAISFIACSSAGNSKPTAEPAVKNAYGFTREDLDKPIIDTGVGTVSFLTYQTRYALIGDAYFTSTPSKSGALQIREATLGICAQEVLYTAKAKELGLELSKEQQAQVDAAGQAALDNLADSIRKYIIENTKSTPTDAQVEVYVQYELSAIGMTQSEYMEYATLSKQADICYSLVNEYYSSEDTCPYSEEELRTRYASITENSASVYRAGAYATYEKAYQAGNSAYRYLYIPEGFLFVRTIKTDSQTDKDTIVAALNAGESFESYVNSELNQDEFIKTMDVGEGYAIGENDCFMDNNDNTIFGKAAEMEIGAWDEVKVGSTYYIFMRVEGQTGAAPYEKYIEGVRSALIMDILNSELTASISYPNEELLDKFDDAYIEYRDFNANKN
ncbi:MAG: hypothetical protein PHT58_08315 [Eubacteriales bacterium]|nr:hypothetical protein [Eubacteriales bacterium]